MRGRNSDVGPPKSAVAGASRQRVAVSHRDLSGENVLWNRGIVIDRSGLLGHRSRGSRCRPHRCLALRVNIAPGVAERRHLRSGLDEDIVWGRCATIWIARRR